MLMTPIVVQYMAWVGSSIKDAPDYLRIQVWWDQFQFLRGSLDWDKKITQLSQHLRNIWMIYDSIMKRTIINMVQSGYDYEKIRAFIYEFVKDIELKRKKPKIIREWCIHWTDRCNIDGSEECLEECFKYCPDCNKCLNLKNAYCLNDGKSPCMHFEYAKYPSPITHHFSCNQFLRGICHLKDDFCRDISYEECPLQIIEKKGDEK